MPYGRPHIASQEKLLFPRERKTMVQFYLKNLLHKNVNQHIWKVKMRKLNRLPDGSLSSRNTSFMYLWFVFIVDTHYSSKCEWMNYHFTGQIDLPLYLLRKIFSLNAYETFRYDCVFVIPRYYSILVFVNGLIITLLNQRTQLFNYSMK